MLSQSKVVEALERKRATFQAYIVGQQRRTAAVHRWLEELVQLDYQAVVDRIGDQTWPGAWPTLEWDAAHRLCLPFGERWSDHQEARAWARRVLENRSTISVDGSQIAPSKELSTPVAAIQIGWFINEHSPNGRYVKDLDFDVLAPGELLLEEDDGDAIFATETVNQERFVRECDKLRALMADASGSCLPLCFFDGSFIISFAGKIRGGRSQLYVGAVEALLAASRDLEVPLVGFVDSPFSRDVTTLLIESVLAPHGEEFILSDADFFDDLLPKWGDRSPFFICGRKDGLSSRGSAPFYQEVAFTYMRLNRGRPPARLEVPKWLVEAGRGEEIVDLVRAECVVGAGYPYAIETADALAVLSLPDRKHFYALFQEFLEEEGETLTESKKGRSKQLRR